MTGNTSTIETCIEENLKQCFTKWGDNDKIIVQ